MRLGGIVARLPTRRLTYLTTFWALLYTNRVEGGLEPDGKRN